jgi:5-formyltetrahydrofolate cyclo-ligase
VRFASGLFSIVKSGQKSGMKSNIVVTNVKKNPKNSMNKSQIRKITLENRNNLTQEQIKALSVDICNKIIDSKEYKQAKNIHIYKSFGCEVQTAKIIEQAFADGKLVIVPKILSEGEMQHTQIYPETIFTQDKYNIESPTQNYDYFDPCQIQANDLILVPVVAFDSKNNRIGYGKGYYDKFLANLNCKKIGIAFDCQLVGDFDADPWDIQLDYIQTNGVGESL